MKKYHYYIITYSEYFEAEDFIEPEDGGHSWSEDHYVHFLSKEDAEKALPQYKAIDEDAHIFEMDDEHEYEIGRA